MASNNTVVSPLLNRIQKQESLTLKNLAYHIPRVREGQESRTILDESKNLPIKERTELYRKVRDGEHSKESLVLMALPLVKTIAHKEYTRRLSWNSRVSFDDMIQEGIGGFLRGIQAYDIEGKQTSATNYLGQWILSDIRRHVETLDHDFSIPHETIERHRKIRAIRSHLFNKLGRTPTDAEILEHANSGAWQPSSKMGKVIKDAPSGNKKLTEKNLDEERSYASATGQLDSIAAVDNDDDYYERKSSPLGGEETPSSTAEVEEASAAASLASLFEKVFVKMNLGSMQEDIVRQKFGLPPHTEEISLSDIAKKTRLTKYKINQVITAFSTEMSAKGSAFHQVVSTLPVDEVDSMGMGWLIPLVGEFDKHTPKRLPDSILTTNLRPMSAKAKTHFGSPNRQPGLRYSTTFECSDGHKTTESYFQARNIPAHISCGECGRTASKIS